MPRKEKKYHFIYKTTNLLSGKYYIGMHSTDNLNDGYMGSGKRLRYSINKYGKENHKVEILEFLDDRETLKNRETEIVNLNEIAKVDCMNLKVGGEGGGFTEEQWKKGAKKMNEIIWSDPEFIKRKKVQSSKNMKNLNKLGKVKPHDWTGRKHSNETKKKMSESKKDKSTGKDSSQYGTCWITKNGENKKIKKEDLETYILQGWEKGRKMK